jgi:hypothetical protein
MQNKFLLLAILIIASQASTPAGFDSRAPFTIQTVGRLEKEITICHTMLEKNVPLSSKVLNPMVLHTEKDVQDAINIMIAACYQLGTYRFANTTLTFVVPSKWGAVQSEHIGIILKLNPNGLGFYHRCDTTCDADCAEEQDDDFGHIHIIVPATHTSADQEPLCAFLSHFKNKQTKFGTEQREKEFLKKLTGQ